MVFARFSEGFSDKTRFFLMWMSRLEVYFSMLLCYSEKGFLNKSLL